MKTKSLILGIAFVLANNLVSAQVGIGTTTPDASAVLELNSTNKGFLFPRLTTTQRDNIVSPAEGLTIYNTVTDKIEVYNGVTWVEAGGLGDLLSTNNLSDLDNAATARTNLGLGTIATQDASSVAITGGAIDGTTIGASTPSTAKFTTLNTSGQVGIGTSSPNPSAALDITSTTGSLLLPRLTTTERDALTTENGMVIYNSTLDVFQVANGGTGTTTISQNDVTSATALFSVVPLGQTFQATASGSFSINLYISTFYTSGNIQLRLYTDNTKSTLLATSNSVAVAGIGDYTFTFTGYDLVNTTSYYFETHITDAFDGNIEVNNTDPYAGGDSNIGAGIDLRFSVSIDSDASWTSLITLDSYTFPSADGNSGEVLSTDGSGTLSWASADVPDATTGLKGKVQLAGDLTGTAALPTIATNAVTTAKILDANITSAKLATSIALTGTPTAPTAAAGTSTTQLATTAFVENSKTNSLNQVHEVAMVTNPSGGWATNALLLGGMKFYWSTNTINTGALVMVRATGTNAPASTGATENIVKNVNGASNLVAIANLPLWNTTAQTFTTTVSLSSNYQLVTYHITTRGGVGAYWRITVMNTGSTTLTIKGEYIGPKYTPGT